MAILKCKMCGGDIVVSDQSYGTCDSCGSTMTLPRIDDDRRANAFNRANHFRRLSDFDKAISAYERILSEDDADAEAHWGVVLSRYGIEYVEDPVSHERIPTCHRVQLDSILADADYLAALAHAPDGYTRSLYEQEAKRIAEIQKGILAISNREEPYDVFLCYKETSEAGTRTKDSTIAQDVYYQLTNEGYKVFFARITLEDKLGQEYEPYIFAALNSAKVMAVIGTSAENFNAVWVKNEWSRYLDLMKKDRSRLLIPCYRDMDPYDLPEELSMLQSQDMGKIGFIQDLVRGVKKVVDAGRAATAAAKPAAGAEAVAAPGISSLLKRGQLYLEDGDWKSADEYFDRVLDIDPEYAPAYVGKLCAELNVRAESALVNCAEPFDENGNYKKALRFSDAAQKAKLTGYVASINERNRQKRLAAAYAAACSTMENALSSLDYAGAATAFQRIPGYKDADEKAAQCQEKATRCAEQEEVARKDGIYACAIDYLETENASVQDCEEAISLFASIPSWKDADQKIEACRQKIAQLEAEKERAAEQRRIKKEENIKKLKKISVIAAAAIVVIMAVVLLVMKVIVPATHYSKAEKLLANGEYEAASTEFMNVGRYKDAMARVGEPYYKQAEALLEAGEYNAAALAFEKAAKLNFGHNTKYLDAGERALDARYRLAESLLAAGEYMDAVQAFDLKTDFKDANERMKEAFYRYGETLLASDDYTDAVSAFTSAGDYKDASERILEAHYKQGERLLSIGNYTSAAIAFTNASDYKDAKTRMTQEYQALLASGDSFAAALILAATGKIKQARTLFNFDNRVSAWGGHTVVLKADGTVRATEYIEYGGLYFYDGQCDVQGWSNIAAISAGWAHTVGLKADGRVVAAGDNSDGECGVSDWRDITSVYAGSVHTVGLKADGTVVAVGSSENGQGNVQDWQDIVAVAAGYFHTVGLKADGTVVATEFFGESEYDYGQCDVQGWSNIAAISAGWAHTVGLKADGRVVAVGYNKYGQCDVQGWRDIIAVAAGGRHTVGLRADGTVVAVGDNENGQCDVSGWKDIVAIAAGNWHTVGLKTDGTVVAVGNNRQGQCNVQSFDLW